MRLLCNRVRILNLKLKLQEIVHFGNERKFTILSEKFRFVNCLRRSYFSVAVPSRLIIFIFITISGKGNYFI